MKLGKQRLSAIVLAVALLVPGLAAATGSFTDVTPGRYYEAPINWARDNGITTGSPAGSDTFRPDNPVTRGESVTFLKRYHDNVVRQSIGSLACTTDQVARFDGSTWVCATPQLLRTPAGWQITTLDNSTNVAGYTSLAMGNDGLPVIAYNDAASTALKLRRCESPDCTAGTTRVLDSANGVNNHISITIGSSGQPIISYLDTTQGDLMAYECGSADCTTGTIRRLDTAGTVGFQSSVAVRGNGNPIISYLLGGITNMALKIYRCSNSGCSSGSAITTGVTTSSSSAVPVAIRGNRLPIIAFVDPAGKLAVFACTDIDCTGGTTTTLGPSSGFASHLDMAIGADGNPIIVYYDTSQSVAVYACTSADCSTGTNRVADGATDVGWYPSIAIGPDGNPIISHLNHFKGLLRFYACSTPNCSSGVGHDIETNNGTGSSTSIGVDPTGSVVISYGDVANQNLKFARMRWDVTGISYP